MSRVYKKLRGLKALLKGLNKVFYTDSEKRELAAKEDLTKFYVLVLHMTWTYKTRKRSVW